MVARPINKIWKISISVLVILLIKVNAIFAGEIYVPEPIIFVHGLNSEEGTWDSAKNTLKKYFVDQATGLPKYNYPDASQKWYYPKCDYESMNTGDIPTIAQSKLTGSVYAGLGALDEIPNCVTKKVNIVSHSMGGLVTRSLLKQSNLQNLVDKVIFIGTPHNGSPYASALWLLNKVAKDKLPDLIKQNKSYFSKPIFSTFGFSANNSVVFKDLGDNLTSRYNNINFALSFVRKFGLNPDSCAIDELRLNQDVGYHSIVSGFAGIRIKSVAIDEAYAGSEVFLSPTKNNLAIPKTYKTIIGINTSNDMFWGLGKILEFGNAFNFPMGETISDVSKNGGDGIVSLNSQEGRLGNVVATVTCTHLDETSQASAILNAIDDAPQIERVYAVPCDWDNGPFYDYYVVIKAKEYLLADLEIESMDLDGVAVDLWEFRDPASRTYKPYHKFGKNFLKKRDNDENIKDKKGNNITLEPGEFYVKVYFPNTPGYGSIPDTNFHTLNVTLKNPAGKTKKERIQIYNTAARATFDAYIIDVPPYTLPPYDAYPRTTTMNNLYVYGSGSSNMRIQLVISGYYIAYPVLRDDNITLDSGGAFHAANYFTWNGSNGKGGKVSEWNDIMFSLDILPADAYASPISGDNRMDLPTRNYLCVVRADPTFIQTHRSHSHLAKYDTLRRFEQYGYSINPAYLNETDTALRRTIDSAVSDIVDIEENFVIEKEKITARARALSQNQPPDHSEDKALTAREADKTLADLIEQLTKAKEIHISAIIENVNNLARAAFAKKAPSAAPASRAQAE